MPANLPARCSKRSKLAAGDRFRELEILKLPCDHGSTRSIADQVGRYRHNENLNSLPSKRQHIAAYQSLPHTEISVPARSKLAAEPLFRVTLVI